MKKRPIFMALCCCLFAFLCLFSISAVAESGIIGGFICEALNWSWALKEYTGSGANFCWFCSILTTFFDAINTLATNVVTKMSRVFLAAMAVGLLFSISFKVIKVIVSLQPVDLMQFLGDLFRHLGRAIVATALLMYSLSVFQLIVNPILTMSISLTQVIVESGDGVSGALIKATRDSGVKIANLCADLKVEDKIRAGNADRAFDEGVRAALECTMRQISSSLMFGITFGGLGMTMAQCERFLVVFPNIALWLIGFGIAVAHLLILVSLPFKFIDSLVRMGFVCALMPLWVVLWVFPATAGYTKKAWDMFFSTCAIFVCMAAVLVLVMTLITSVFPNIDQIAALLVADNPRAAYDSFPLSGTRFFIAMILCGMGWKLLGSATTLASSFVGNIPNLGVGDQFASTAIRMGKAGVKGGGALGALGFSMLPQKMQNGLKSAGKTMAKLGKSIGGRAALGVLTGGASLAAEGVFRGGKWAFGKLQSKKSAPKGRFEGGPGGGSGGPTPGGGTSGGPTPSGGGVGGGSGGPTPSAGGAEGGAPTKPDLGRGVFSVADMEGASGKRTLKEINAGDKPKPRKLVTAEEARKREAERMAKEAAERKKAEENNKKVENAPVEDKKPTLPTPPVPPTPPTPPTPPAAVADKKVPTTPTPPAAVADKKVPTPPVPPTPPTPPTPPAAVADKKVPTTPTPPAAVVDKKVPTTPTPPAAVADKKVPTTPTPPAAVADKKVPTTPTPPAAAADKKVPTTEKTSLNSVPNAGVGVSFSDANSRPANFSTSSGSQGSTTSFTMTSGSQGDTRPAASAPAAPSTPAHGGADNRAPQAPVPEQRQQQQPSKGTSSSSDKKSDEVSKLESKLQEVKSTADKALSEAELAKGTAYSALNRDSKKEEDK